jgi:hypothetical protein
MNFKQSVIDVVAALNAADIRYIIVGGLAVASHGYLRTTKDIDLVVALDPHNVVAAFASLAKTGYRPKVPITAADFSDAATRERLIREKNMIVLQFWRDESPDVDVFVCEPFDFDAEWVAARIEKVTPDLITRVVRLEVLLDLKREASRPQDLADIDALTKLYEV